MEHPRPEQVELRPPVHLTLDQLQPVDLAVDCFNAFNSRNFGIPSGVASSPGFLNQWATDGGNRRIRFGLRLLFQ